jgi:hypothetical protein
VNFYFPFERRSKNSISSANIISGFSGIGDWAAVNLVIWISREEATTEAFLWSLKVRSDEEFRITT